MARNLRRLSFRFCVATFLPALGGCGDDSANADTDATTSDTTGDTEPIGINTMSTSGPSTTNTSNTSPSTTDATATDTESSSSEGSTGGSDSTSLSGATNEDSSSSSSDSDPSTDDTTTSEETTTTTTDGTTTTNGTTTSETTTNETTTGIAGTTMVFESTGAEATTGGSESTGDPEADQDGDGLPNAEDNCPAVENPDQSDIDIDGQGDWCDDEIIDDGDRLYVPRNTSYELFGAFCYTGEVRIYGTLNVTPMTAAVGGGTLTIASALRLWVPAGGMISATAAGYAGGARSAMTDRGGFVGEGPGAGCGGGPGGCVANGGSGGGYGGSGGRSSHVNPYALDVCDSCSEATISHCAGPIGVMNGTADGEDVEFGSGGGAGGNSCGCSDSGGLGGAGGGIIVLVSDESVRIDGTVRANGEHPPVDTSACGYHPGGGGGSGGTIVLAAASIEGDASGIVSARGGRGGNSPGDFMDWAWAGGGGGGGRIKLFGATDSFTANTIVSGGQGGAALPAIASYIGEPGDLGTVGGDTEIPAIWADFVCE